MGDNRKKGGYGERLAAARLEAEGYIILTMNYRCAAGEIDIIAEKNRTLVFVEVKYRQSLACGYPAEAVTPAKQRRIRSSARNYIYAASQSRTPVPENFRFDVIQIIDRGEPVIEHIENAF